MNRFWTVADLVSLRELYNQNLSVDELAKHFNRTTGSIRLQVYRLRGSKYKQAPRLYGWTAEQDASFIKDYTDGMIFTEMIEVHLRTEGTLRIRARKLGLPQRVLRKRIEADAIELLPSVRGQTPRVTKAPKACYTCENKRHVWDSSSKGYVECPACK